MYAILKPLELMRITLGLLDPIWAYYIQYNRWFVELDASNVGFIILNINHNIGFIGFDLDTYRSFKSIRIVRYAWDLI